MNPFYIQIYEIIRESADKCCGLNVEYIDEINRFELYRSYLHGTLYLQINHG